MDKRTLISIFAFTIILMFVNMYFDQQRQSSHQEQQTVEKLAYQESVKKLEQLISLHPIEQNRLPLVELKDQEGNLLSQALDFGGNLLTLSWDNTVPDTVEVEGQGTFSLSVHPKGVDTLVIYTHATSSTLEVARLNPFGQENLVVVSFHPNQQLYALNDEGTFVIPSEKIIQIRKSLGSEPMTNGEENAKPIRSGLVLRKTGDAFQPVAIYRSSTSALQYLDDIANLKTTSSKSSAEKGEATFYLLEDGTQQLVFSDVGGALAEINLPFTSETHPDSIVREVSLDREINEESSINGHFPSRSTLSPDGKENPIGPIGGYYPLLRRNLIRESSQTKSTKIDPKYYALNIISEYPELAELKYDVVAFDRSYIVFEAKLRHRTIRKTFRLTAVPYVFNLTIEIEGDAKGLWLTSGVPEVELISGSPAPALKLRKMNTGKVEELKLPSDGFTTNSEYLDWICNSNGFFGTILDPLSPNDPGYRTQFIPGDKVPSRILAVKETTGEFQADKLPGYMTLLPLPSKGGKIDVRVVAGPFGTTILSTIDKTFTDPATGKGPDYTSCKSYHGWFSFISIPFSKFLFTLMQFFYYLTHSWGLSIILLTLALRVMLFPLNAWSMKSIAKSQKIAPKLKAIQEKFKKDPQKMQLEIMNLYRDEGVNPISGCFPMLIQIPFLFGMFDLLKSTFALRGAPFIPGWIDDLAAPDVLFSWDTPILFFGTTFHLLPFVMGGVMFLQSKFMNPTPVSEMTDEQRQQKAMMGTLLPAMMVLFFYNVPSGLNIYFMSSTLLGILQQWWTNKQIAK